MLQIKNTLGGGKPEGLYVWKKYEVIPPTIVTDPSFKHYGDSSYARIYIISPNFDVNAIDDWVSFFDGFSVNGEGNSYIFSKSGNTLRVKPSSTTSYVSVTDFVISSGSSDYGDYVAYFTLASALSYSVKTNKYIGDKEITQLKTGTFLNYIVSDKETAYPDGGEKGGYWYERAGDAKVASGEITFSSAVNTITIEHGLGAKPKYVFLIGIKKEANSDTYKLINGYKDNESSRIITMESFSDGTGGFKPTSAISGELSASTFAEIQADATNITMPVSYVYKTQVKYAGIYKWFAIA